jgi:O-antigen ligase
MSTPWLVGLAALPLLLTLVVACLREPVRWALPIFAVLVPFGKALSIGPSRFGSISSLVGLLVIGGLVLQLVRNRQGARRLSPTVPIWLLFLGIACATTAWTIDLAATLQGLAVLGSLVVLYVLVTLSHVDRQALRRIENGVLIGGVLAVGYGLYQLLLLGGFPGDQPGEGITPDGRFGNDLIGPGVEAVALLLPLAIAVNRAFVEGARTRLINAVIGGLMLWGVLMTGSRTGTLAAAVVLLTLAVAGPRRARGPLALWLGAALVVGGAVWLYHPAGVATRTFDSALSSSGRVDIWRVGIDACPKYCALGAGWGTYPDVYAQTQASVPGARVLVGQGGSYQPHNLWLLAVVELGVPGLLLLTLGLLTSLGEGIRLPSAVRGPPVAALAGLTVAVFFLSSMEFKFFWMTLIMVSLNRQVYGLDAGLPAAAPATDVPTPLEG